MNRLASIILAAVAALTVYNTIALRQLAKSGREQVALAKDIETQKRQLRQIENTLNFNKANAAVYPGAGGLGGPVPEGGGPAGSGNNPPAVAVPAPPLNIPGLLPSPASSEELTPGQIAVLEENAAAAAARAQASPPPALGGVARPGQTTAQTAAQTPSTPPKRNWGPEQASGAPDTFQAGDIPTAWASRDPDGGTEWLQLEYDSAVAIASVGIYETYNPGAVSKVTALANGQELTVWEGVSEPGDAPSELSVPARGNVTAKVIIIYLDSSRVPGWNEIDAVELVGRDGSRQWASGARASSTYAERGAQPPLSPGTVATNAASGP